jgi:hypothetical protein
MTTNTGAAVAERASNLQQNPFRNINSHGQLDVHHRLANSIPAPSVTQRVEDTNKKLKDLGYKPVSVALQHNKMMQDLDKLL